MKPDLNRINNCKSSIMDLIGEYQMITNKYYKFLKDYIIQECKHYERVYAPDDRYFPREELYGYINAYYDLEYINDDEKQKLFYIVEKLHQYYQTFVTLFLGDELMKEMGQ